VVRERFSAGGQHGANQVRRARAGLENHPHDGCRLFLLSLPALLWTLALACGEGATLSTLSHRILLVLALSGVATGLSWLAYFRALQLAPASQVAPIDKLSLALTLVLAWALLGERMPWKLVVGVALMIGGALLTLG
jgi:bacterial/archaeal transporter family protein